MVWTGRLLPAFLRVCRRWDVRPTRQVLIISVRCQQLRWYRATLSPNSTPTKAPHFVIHRILRASTSRFGTGQRLDSRRTPLGLHRIARKIGDGWPQGTVFRGRAPVGLTWRGLPDAAITHRILWLDGLEPLRNRGGDVDSFRRYIYLHGTSDEPSLGRPASQGCIHLAAADLMPLFDRIPVGTLVWITENA